jgi:hypothetical protein
VVLASVFDDIGLSARIASGRDDGVDAVRQQAGTQPGRHEEAQGARRDGKTGLLVTPP